MDSVRPQREFGRRGLNGPPTPSELARPIARRTPERAAVTSEVEGGFFSAQATSGYKGVEAWFPFAGGVLAAVFFVILQTRPNDYGSITPPLPAIFGSMVAGCAVFWVLRKVRSFVNVFYKARTAHRRSRWHGIGMVIGGGFYVLQSQIPALSFGFGGHSSGSSPTVHISGLADVFNVLMNTSILTLLIWASKMFGYGFIAGTVLHFVMVRVFGFADKGAVRTENSSG